MRRWVRVEGRGWVPAFRAGRLMEGVGAMGSLAALESVVRVLERHGDDLVAELREQYGDAAEVVRFELEAGIYEVRAYAVLGSGARLELRPYDIDDLAGRFPDCEVGY